MIDNRVRIVLRHEGQQHYFVRFNAETNIEAVPFEQIRQAVLLRRDVALDLCKKLNARGFKAQIITPGGIVLYAESTTPAPQQAQSPERQNMTIAGLLFVVGGPPRNGYWLRFPGTQIESMWGSTPEALYEKLTQHPLAADLIKAGEKYVAPPAPPADTAAIERELHFKRHGRIRPGSLD